MRFQRRNWDKYFDGSNKKTTIRTRKSRIGHHKAYTGSYYKPIVLGEFDIVKVITKSYQDLTFQDAKLDGFRSLEELQEELIRLNGLIEHDTFVYQHWIENANKKEENGSPPTLENVGIRA